MTQTPVQTKQDIAAIMEAAGLRPDRTLGQHFLIDGNLMRKLVASAELTASDIVLEVGGGTGGLSDQLATRAGRLVIVEIDHDLAPLLTERFDGFPNVTVIHGDALKNKHTIAPEVMEACRVGTAYQPESETPHAPSPYKLVANLPYHIATPLIMNLLTASPRFDRMCFTIQKEVADRLVAQAGSRDFGPLAIVVQTTCEIAKVARLPAQAFWPAPKVESSMLRLDRKPHPFEQGDQLQRFLDLVHAAFAHRRKTLRFNLSRHLDEAAMQKVLSTVSGDERAERVELEKWIELGRNLLT